MWKDIEWPGKGPGSSPLVLPWFLVVDLDLRLNLRYLKIELKVLVDCFFYNLITWSPYTVSDNVGIIIMAT